MEITATLFVAQGGIQGDHIPAAGSAPMMGYPLPYGRSPEIIQQLVLGRASKVGQSRQEFFADGLNQLFMNIGGEERVLLSKFSKKN